MVWVIMRRRGVSSERRRSSSCQMYVVKLSAVKDIITHQYVVMLIFKITLQHISFPNNICNYFFNIHKDYMLIVDSKYMQ